MKEACTCPFAGTVTCVGDHDAVAPGICGDQFSAAGITVPANPDTLLNVTVKLAVLPFATVWVALFTDALKSPVPLYVMLIVELVTESFRVPAYRPSCCRMNGPRL